jgi:cbb3-type cytochrome oxidase maturation protein
VRILFVLIPLSLVLLGIAIWGFFWMVRNDQFDDLEAEGWKVLSDDDDAPKADRRD